MQDINATLLREYIRQLVRRLEKISKTNSDCSSLPLSQCHALTEIGRAGTLSLKMLSNILLIDISTTSRAVDALVKRGLVCRLESLSDRRCIEISLTPEGITLFRIIEDSMDAIFLNTFNSIPSNKQEDVITSLHILNTAFDSLQ